MGALSRGCRRCDVDCHPVASSSRFRWSADHRNSPRSRSRWPASQRTSPDSEPSVVENCRLITGRDRAGASTAPAEPWLSRRLTSCLYFSWHAARRCYPVDRVSSSCARAPSEVTSMILARDPGRADADLIEWPMNRVASAEAGRQPFPPLRAHDDAVRSTLRALHEETAVSRRGESGHQRRRPSCNGTVWR